MTDIGAQYRNRVAKPASAFVDAGHLKGMTPIADGVNAIAKTHGRMQLEMPRIFLFNANVVVAAHTKNCHENFH
jgi:hypothetical protein